MKVLAYPDVHRLDTDYRETTGKTDEDFAQPADISDTPSSSEEATGQVDQSLIWGRNLSPLPETHHGEFSSRFTDLSPVSTDLGNDTTVTLMCQAPNIALLKILENHGAETRQYVSGYSTCNPPHPCHVSSAHTGEAPGRVTCGPTMSPCRLDEQQSLRRSTTTALSPIQEEQLKYINNSTGAVTKHDETQRKVFPQRVLESRYPSRPVVARHKHEQGHSTMIRKPQAVDSCTSSTYSGDTNLTSKATSQRRKSHSPPPRPYVFTLKKSDTNLSSKVKPPKLSNSAPPGKEEAPAGRAIKHLLSQPLMFSYDCYHEMTDCWHIDCGKHTRSSDNFTCICPKCGPYSAVRYCSTTHLYADLSRHYLGECGRRNNSLAILNENSIDPLNAPIRSFISACNPQDDSLERHRQALYRSFPIDPSIDYYIFGDADLVNASEPLGYTPTPFMMDKYRGRGAILAYVKLPTDFQVKTQFSHALEDLLRTGLSSAISIPGTCLLFFSWIKLFLEQKGLWSLTMMERVGLAMQYEFGYKVPVHMLQINDLPDE